ncbi:hypothetical protein SLEP1_g15049 [Rubroshorea leprosula]|uniref:Uncharacterized protein n=1 Tax=Rubroshorea leprosula TaxID=152421 RepID=A0AAV5IL56_9ROSI|nr:hypothetical protein SLEP1_g15049 [Rubroshorea leprosula]
MASIRPYKFIVGSATSGFGFVSFGFDSNMCRDLAHYRLGQRLTMPLA